MTPTEAADLLAALTAERYGVSAWWKRHQRRPTTPSPAPSWDDSEITTARRRRALVADRPARRETA